MLNSFGLGQSLRPLTLAWLVAAVLVLILPIRSWTSTGTRPSLTRPVTPTDHANPGLAEQWQFLDGASAVLPAGCTYTVRSRDPDVEMSLHMVSLGLIRHARALPSSYYGRPTRGRRGRHAQYVLAYDGVECAEPGLEVVARLEHGVVLRRRAPGASE